ncbi:MAG: iron-sulfur cluster repair di-iron protein [Flavobacteriales bacterium]|nr:iron-sulfur cluster repair di-iron protein [Flavobacteriales bacterium]
MNITENDIVGELVAKDYRMASIFKLEGIDFCCRGNRSILEVSAHNKIEPEKLIAKLNSVTTKEIGATDYDTWPVNLLADYIEKKHHRYVEEKITEIKPYLAKIIDVHGGLHPELEKIQKLFLASAGELTLHMKKEELVLFPFVRKMIKYKQDGKLIEPSNFGTVGNPIAMMKEDHDNEGVRFRKIAELSNNYAMPSDGCNTFQVTYALLKEFEEDLHLHIHLENNILFPKALEMERQLVN